MRLLISLLCGLTVGLVSSTWANPSTKESDPVLKPNDVLQMVVFEEQELTTQTRVLKSGEVALPLIGIVKVGGLTISQANQRVKELYAADYLVDPKVTLTVSDYSEEFVTVIGAVKNPGQLAIPASGKFDLSSAIASAGGLNPDADPHNIVLTAAAGTSSTHSVTSSNGTIVTLRAGDRVVVSQSAFVNKSATILGQVQKPGAVPFPFDGRLDLVGAIAAAGGFTELANQKKVTVNRKGKIMEVDVKKLSQEASEPFHLKPDDIVNVRERIF